MDITICVPGMLRASCGGASTLTLAAPNVRGALESIEEAHPELYRSVCNETGAVRQHMNLFVNSDNVRDLEGLNTPLASGDTLSILPAVSGG